MIARVNCPIAGCGIPIQVQNLPKHLEKIHQLDGELMLRLHPSSPYNYLAGPAPEPENEPEE